MVITPVLKSSPDDRGKKGHVRGQNMKREHNWPGEALQVLCSGQNGMKASKLFMCNSLRDPDLSSGPPLFYADFNLTWRLTKETYGFDTSVLVTHKAVSCIEMIFPAGLMFQETPRWVKSHDSSGNSIKTICKMKHRRVKGKPTEPSQTHNRNISSQSCQWANTINKFEEFWSCMGKKDKSYEWVSVHCYYFWCYWKWENFGCKSQTRSKEGNKSSYTSLNMVLEFSRLLEILITVPSDSRNEGRLPSNSFFLRTEGILRNPQLLGINYDCRNGGWRRAKRHFQYSSLKARISICL